MEDEKWTTKEKQVTIKELEEKIVTLGSNPNDGSQIKYVIDTKYNEITNLNIN